jgi:clan AA aspartic protease (TIGR02281 family)
LSTIVFALTLNLLMAICAQELRGQPVPPYEQKTPDSKVKLFTAPNLSSAQVGILEKGKSPTPIAETLGPGGETWYLVKSNTGFVGWMKKSDTEESRKVEQFFKSLPVEPSLSIATNISTVSSTSAPRDSIIVPVQMNGPAVIVPVILNRMVHTHMALDTGATRTVLSLRTADRLGLNRSGATTVVETANGSVAVGTANLASTKVGDAEVENLIVTVHNFSSNPRLGGLLGLDFLRHFHVSLDSRKQVLVLSPR